MKCSIVANERQGLPNVLRGDNLAPTGRPRLNGRSRQMCTLKGPRRERHFVSVARRECRSHREMGGERSVQIWAPLDRRSLAPANLKKASILKTKPTIVYMGAPGSGPYTRRAPIVTSCNGLCACRVPPATAERRWPFCETAKKECAGCSVRVLQCRRVIERDLELVPRAGHRGV